MSRLDRLADATTSWRRQGIITDAQATQIMEAEVEDLAPGLPGLVVMLSAAAAGLLLGSLVGAAQQESLGAVLGAALAAAGFSASIGGHRGLAEAFWTASMAVWATLFLLLAAPSVAVGVIGLAWLWVGLVVDLSAAARVVWVMLHGAALAGALGVFGVTAVAPWLVAGSLVYVAASWLRTDPMDTARPWLIGAAGVGAVLTGVGSAVQGGGPSTGAWLALAVGTGILVALLAWSPGGLRTARWELPWDA